MPSSEDVTQFSKLKDEVVHSSSLRRVMVDSKMGKASRSQIVSRWLSTGAAAAIVVSVATLGCSFVVGGHVPPQALASSLSARKCSTCSPQRLAWTPTSRVPAAVVGATCALVGALVLRFRTFRRTAVPFVQACFPHGRNPKILTCLFAGSGESEGLFPALCVFDLDACLWDKEMFEMDEIPSETDRVMGDLNGKGEGVIGVMSGCDKISLHKGALMALQAHAEGRYPGMRIAVASSADTPFAERVGRAALKLLEVVPGLTVWDLLTRDWNGRDVNQIGRQPPLSSDKSATHFPRLKEATDVPYDKMLFFDDCNWGDHVGKVCKACIEKDSGRGVVGVRTPRGLGEAQWLQGLELYRSEAARVAA